MVPFTWWSNLPPSFCVLSNFVPQHLLLVVAEESILSLLKHSVTPPSLTSLSYPLSLLFMKPIPRIAKPCHWLQSSPDAVEDIAIPGDSQQFVVRGDLMEVGPLLIGKEQVRLPDGI